MLEAESLGAAYGAKELKMKAESLGPAYEAKEVSKGTSRGYWALLGLLLHLPRL